MPSSRSTGILGLIAAVVITGGLTFTGMRLYKLDSSGNVDKSKTFSVAQPVLVNCTATGGKANYSPCYFQNPFTGSGVFRRLELHVEANPRAAQFDCGVVSSLTASGVGIQNNGAVASGSALVPNVTSALMVPPGWYVKCAAGGNPGTGFRAVMLTEITEYYER